MSIAWLGGRWIEEADAFIPADDRGFLYGDAVFETGRLVAGGYFRLDRHLERLEASAAALRLPVPPRDELARVARGLADRNGFADATLRFTVTRGGARGPLLLATLAPMERDWRSTANRGWRIVTAGVRHPPASALPQVKTPGRLHGLLARAEARRAGADDALLLSAEGHVVEGPSWNLFWRVGATLFTPAAETGLLEGLTRAALLDLAPPLGLTVEEGLFPRAHLDLAEEAFATMTSVGVVPFSALDGRVLPVAQRRAASALFEAYWDLVAREAR